MNDFRLVFNTTKNMYVIWHEIQHFNTVFSLSFLRINTWYYFSTIWNEVQSECTHESLNFSFHEAVVDYCQLGSDVDLVLESNDFVRLHFSLVLQSLSIFRKINHLMVLLFMFDNISKSQFQFCFLIDYHKGEVSLQICYQTG